MAELTVMAREDDNPRVHTNQARNEEKASDDPTFACVIILILLNFQMILFNRFTFNLDDIVTPVDPVKLKFILVETGYDEQKTNFVVQGFTQGFDLAYRGSETVQLCSKNLKFKGVGNNTILWNKVMKEVSLGQYAGPFQNIPFEHYIQSPIGLVPKDDGKDVRLIFHLSHPHNMGMSVNANTPKELCSVQYPSFDDAVRLCHATGVGYKLAKSDFRSAFCNAPLKREVWKWVVLMAKSPFDQKEYFFVDKCLPFGTAISCAVFQAISDAITHIVQTKTGKK